MRQVFRIRGFALALLACWMQSVAGTGNSVEGKWTFTEFVESEESSAECRWLNVTTRRFDLKRGVAGGVAGGYTRNNRVVWLGPTANCPRKVSLDNYEELARMDGWYVNEASRSEKGVVVDVEYNDCVGACEDGTYTLDRFRTRLRVQNGVMVDDPLDGTPELVFVPEDRASELERDASKRMFELVSPMYEGKCSRFYEESYHPLAQATTPKGEFCQAVRKFGDLLPPVLYHKSLTVLRFDWGEFKRPFDGVRWQIWSGGDVLVEQFWTVAADGGGVPVAAVLRKDERGDWKVIVPGP